MGRGSRVAGWGVMLVAAMTLAACGGAGKTGPAQTSTLALSSPVASTPVASDPAGTVADAVVACREKDAARLRALVSTPVTDEEIQALFARGNDVLLKGQTPSITGDQASAHVELEVHRDSGTELVERTWALARGADGVWRLTTLPDCY